MDVPDYLISEAKRGRLVLFFGAGAAFGSTHPEGRQAPSGIQLAKDLANHFLGGKHADEPLDVVGEMATAISDLFTVQNYIRERFEGFQPSEFHLQLPTFRWRALFTTNYDTIIEKAYLQQKDRVQRLVPLISNRDRVDDLVRTKDDLIYVKLHGCITRSQDEETPFILTPDQYVKHRSGRSRLFNLLHDLGHEYPIVFIGYEIRDSDLRVILNELDQLNEARPRYYMVKPNVDEIEVKLWEQKRITPINGTLQEFVEHLNREIPVNIRSLVGEASYSHPIQTKFVVEEEVSDIAADFIQNDVNYIYPELPIVNASPLAFYRGFDLGWYPIQEGLDIRRTLVDNLLSDIIILDETDRNTHTELYVIKAEAGAGKTILLRRLAWESAKDWNKLCLFLAPYGRLHFEPLIEIYRLTRQRLFLFVDNTGDQISELLELILRARKEKLPITIITAERINEWNVSCEERLEQYVTEHFILRYLNHKEIRSLIQKLEDNHALGRLESLTLEAKVKEFEYHAGRQLLVALHEATSGKRFEDILEDEYNAIKPQQAQSIYRAVCILNRFQVGVRAGVISRVFGVPFARFERDFFKPLDHVVQVVEHPHTHDMLYQARHPEIAQMVFQRVLKHVDDRFNECASLLNALNISYDSDLIAYRKLIRARALMSIFPDHQMILKLFNIAEQIAPEDFYRLQQQGIYAMNRPNGNLSLAYRHLKESERRNPNNITVLHSLAELARIQAKQASSTAERTRYRQDARNLITQLLRNERNRNYALHTKIKLAMDEFEEALQNDEATDIVIADALRKIERELEQGLQEFPGEAALLQAESDFRKLLNDEHKALGALQRAFEANQRNASVAIRLAKLYSALKDDGAAITTLTVALEANRGEARLHY